MRALPQFGFRSIPVLLPALGLLAQNSAAEAVHLVSQPQLGHFATIQAAVDAASDGETLLIAPGYYGGFTVNGKGLTVIAPLGTVNISETITITGLSAAQAVRLSQLVVVIPGDAMSNTPAERVIALRGVGNQGQIWLQDCLFTGAIGVGSVTGVGEPGGAGAEFLQCAHVLASNCAFTGGTGGGCVSSNCYGGSGGVGGSGVRANGGQLSFQACTLTAAMGGTNGSSGGAGGHGLHAIGVAHTRATGTTFKGGKGGEAWDFLCIKGGAGGHGINATSGEVKLLASPIIAGGAGNGQVCPDGSAGQPFFGAANLEVLPDPARTLSANDFSGDGTSLAVEVHGQAGDKVWLATALRWNWLHVSGVFGVWLLPYPHPLTLIPQGTIPASGTLSLAPFVSDFAVPAQIRLLQALVVDTQGQAYFTGGRHAVVINRTAQPDCNSNGLNDWLDVFYGVAPDWSPRNLVPDSCEH